ncbi:hypothetical protein M8C21_033782 [Ambrosia artemisiifolia]|uniref:Transmembrane protein n=1 Tax=Ambrosia artemisiifolia TaxID=4212 RepID=A0AAD5D359_AMBAR|nr:hypothetical protein M8C21_033782 [Ambrosia artemisiifolia]
MHRQSLGSPASKLHSHSDGNGMIISDDHRKDKLPSCSTRLVHLIPVLTFLCFLILYLSSHDPSRKDLAHFTGLSTLSSNKNVIDSIEVEDNLQGLIEIRSMRNLQQEEQHHRRLHRKFGQ